MSPLATTSRARGSRAAISRADRVGGRGREQDLGAGVRRALDDLAEVAPGLGGRALAVDQAPLLEPGGRLGPLLLGPAPAVAQQLGRHPGLGGEQHVRLAAVEPGAA